MSRVTPIPIEVADLGMVIVEVDHIEDPDIIADLDKQVMTRYDVADVSTSSSFEQGDWRIYRIN